MADDVPVLGPAGGAGISENSRNGDRAIPHIVTPTGIRAVPYGAIAEAVKSGKATSKGATGAILITVNGKKMIYKAGSMGRVANEYIAYQLYEAAGARVPRSYLVVNVDMEGGGEKSVPMAVMTEFLEGSLTVRQVLDKGVPIPETSVVEARRKTRKPGGGKEHMVWRKTLKAQAKERRKTAKIEKEIGYVPLTTGEESLLRYALRSEFVYHALFLNWDAKNADNHLVVPKPVAVGSSSESSEGTKWSLLSYNTESSSESSASAKKPVMPSYDYDIPVTIDLGGSLFYRAMGETKAKRFLLTDEIPELVKIPEQSAETVLKLYKELRKEKTLHGVVCARAAKIDSERVMAVVEAMRPLFKFLPIGADLPALISGRLGALRAFCEGRYNLELIRAEEGYTEYKVGHGEGPIDFRKVRPRNMEFARKKATAEAIVRKRLPIVAASLAEEAVEPLRMRGKRTVSVTAGSPVTREEMELVVMAEDWEPPSEFNSENYGSNTSNSEDDIIPHPRFTIVQDSTPLARSLRSKVLAMTEDPAIEEWLRRQEDYLNGLTGREYDILNSYTRNGDVLVNEYLRRRLKGDVTGLIEAMIRIDPDNPERPLALGYSLYDQYPELIRSGKLLVVGRFTRQDDLLEVAPTNSNSGSSSSEHYQINMNLLREIIGANLNFFGRAENILPLVEQYSRELRAIVEKAPRAPRAFRVFRGFQSEAHLSGLTFESVEFLSSSLTPDRVVRGFTNVVEDKDALVTRDYHCCVYELEVSPMVPCIYLEPNTQFSGEFEILIAPGVTVSLEPTVHFKRFIDPDPKIVPPGITEEQLYQRLSRPYGGKMVSVVEGTVSMPRAKDVRRFPELVFDSNELSMANRTVSSERFVSQKPRSMMVGRNRTRRRSPSWKSVRRGDTAAVNSVRRATRRRTSSGAKGL